MAMAFDTKYFQYAGSYPPSTRRTKTPRPALCGFGGFWRWEGTRCSAGTWRGRN